MKTVKLYPIIKIELIICLSHRNSSLYQCCTWCVNEVLLATLRRGDIVGEMSLIDNQPRMASARIKSDTKMTVISREDLAARLGRLAETDKVLRRIIDVFVDRLRGQARMYE